MANLLKKPGYNVYYGSALGLKAGIEKFGFPFILLPAVPVVSINFTNRAAKIKYFLDYLYDVLYPSASDKLKKNIEVFCALVSEIMPDLVLLDEQTSIKAFLYEKLDIPVILFQTKPDTRKIAGLPPFTSYYMPVPGILNAFLCSLLWRVKLLKYYLNKQLRH